MDEMKAMENLVRLACRERPPETDAAPAVLARLRAGAGLRTGRVLPLSVLAAVAAVAAAVILVLAIQAWTAPADPQAVLFPVLEVASL